MITKKIWVYDFGHDGLHVEIEKTFNRWEAWLSHKNIGQKLFIIGVPLEYHKSARSFFNFVKTERTLLNVMNELLPVE